MQAETTCVQEYSSKGTSINSAKLPAVFNNINWFPQTMNADIGGGRFDNASEFLYTNYGIRNIIHDPFNRSSEYNTHALEVFSQKICQTATIANVLNVIKESEIRLQIIHQAFDAIKDDGEAYFQIYEGDKSGNPKATCKGWQENRKADTYVEEIAQVFRQVERHGNIIIGRKTPKKIEFQTPLIKNREYIKEGR